MIELTINGRKIQTAEGNTILEAARENGIEIPTLCYLEGVHAAGACRICVVEVEGAKNLQASCITKAAPGMAVHTHSPVVRQARRVLYELILSDHAQDCLACKRNQSCELQALGRTLGIEHVRFAGARSAGRVDASVSITRDLGKCILCRRCVSVCNEIQGTGILNVQNRGFASEVGPALDLPLGSVACAFCGPCTTVCPVGALRETDGAARVWDALADPDKRVVVQVAPAVRVAIGEEFGFPAGSRCTGKLAAALHALGFDDVFDTNWAADLTIMEEGGEFLTRLQKSLVGESAHLPMITSCSPGWIKYVEHHYPDQLAHLSTCKSPHTMLGAVAKSYYAEKAGVAASDMFVVSVMPCTAKKFEIARPEMKNGGQANVDAVITTRELAAMIRGAGIDFESLPEGRFDAPLGLSSGAADIFGLTGGVMEAALRTVYELVTGREVPFANLHVDPIVGFDQIKEGTIHIEDPKAAYAALAGAEIRVAVTSGLKGAQKLMEQVRAGKSPYHFIEVMGCPGGCIMGGGQPRSQDPAVREKRLAGLYAEDEGKAVRKSHENPAIQQIYADYLGQPGSARAHELLHTAYTQRGIDNELTGENYVLPQEPAAEYAVAASPAPMTAGRGEEQKAGAPQLTAENRSLREELVRERERANALRAMIARLSREG